MRRHETQVRLCRCRSIVPTTEALVKYLLPVSISACALVATAAAAPTATPTQPSAFLPALGQTVTYRYSNAVTTPKGGKSGAATLTIKTISESEVQITIADSKGSQRLDFRVDQAGALQLASTPEPSEAASRKHGAGDSGEEKNAVEALLSRLSIAARISARPGTETSFPIQLNIPWASGPVNPILHVASTTPEALVGNACDTTSINPPERQRHHTLIPVGLGLIGGAIGGTTGRIAEVAGTGATAVAMNRRHSGPIPVDIKLHITGHLVNGRLRTISGDQEIDAHAGKHSNTFSDKWSLVAE